MNEFVSRFGSLVTGSLSGFDRLVFRGSLQPLMHPGGLLSFLSRVGVKLLDFKDFACSITDRLREASLAEARRLDRPIVYLESPKQNKEAVARKLLVEHPIDQGLICVLTALEPCRTYEYHRASDLQERGMKLRLGKCLHIYQYFLHPHFGFMNARIQTWLPYNIQICLNGREWLSHQLQREGSKFLRADNCFPWLEDPQLAQRLMNAQLDTDWPRALNDIARSLNPLHQTIFRAAPMDYYWSAYQTEWATDVMFKGPSALAELYPRLVHLAMHHFKSPDVMRFLGGKLNGNFLGELVSSFKDRPEGVRVKHWRGGNSVKMYDKAGSILRVETTIAKVSDFKAFRPEQDKPKGKLKWLPLRKGVADLHRRAEVSQKSNDAYLDALAAVDDTAPCCKFFDAVSRPALDHGRRVRAMRLSSPEDVALLEAVTRGEFTTSGFRNRDITRMLHPELPKLAEADRRRLSAKTSRLFRLLRAHGIIRKIQKTHRYRLTKGGQLLSTALFSTRNANIKKLLDTAA